MITQHQHEGVTNPIFECWLVSWSGNHNADDVNYQERWLYTHGRTGIGRGSEQTGSEDPLEDKNIC